MNTKIAKQRVIANKPTRKIKWSNEKYSVNPEECRKREKRELRSEKRNSKYQDDGL